MNNDLCHCRKIHPERINKAKKTALPETVTENLARLFKTVADGTRLKIILALEQGEMCVCDLAAFLEISESAVSHQLRTLKQMQFVVNRRDGPILYYRIDNTNLCQLIHTGIENLGK